MEVLDITVENNDSTTEDYFLWLAEQWNEDEEVTEDDLTGTAAGLPNDLGSDSYQIPYGALDDLQPVYSDCGLPGVELVSATSDVSASAGEISVDVVGAAPAEFPAAA